MHLPDGFLDARTCAGTYCLAAAGLGWAGRQVRTQWSDRSLPLIGVMSAFVFAGQMVNFPVAMGTSGHLLGGMLAAAFLGPAAAVVALTVVLVVQCFLFQDGGVTALGANVLNLALLGVISGYGTYRLIRRFRPDPAWQGWALGLGAWMSVVVASLACALELAASGTAPFRLVLPAMVLTHAVIGGGEGLITATVAVFVLRIRPDLLYRPGERSGGAHSGSTRGIWMGWGLATLGVVLLLAPWASALPDGLEAVAHRLGFSVRTTEAAPAPLPDYAVPGVPWAWLSTVLAALAGLGLIGSLVWLGGRLLSSGLPGRPASAGSAPRDADSTGGASREPSGAPDSRS